MTVLSSAPPIDDPRFCPPDHLSRAAAAGEPACPGCGWLLDVEVEPGIGDRIELRPSGRAGQVRGTSGSLFLVAWDDGFGPTRVSRAIVVREGSRKPWEEVDEGTGGLIVSTERPRCRCPRALAGRRHLPGCPRRGPERVGP